MINSIINSDLLTPLVTPEARRNLKIISIAVVAISILATLVFFTGGLALPAAVLLGAEILIWGVLPTITGLWQIYVNAYDLANENKGSACTHCGHTNGLPAVSLV